MRAAIWGGIALFAATSLSAQTATGQATLPAGHSIALVTTGEVSSKTARKGDLVPLKTEQDVTIGGRVVIPAGTPATGQITLARAKGALGQSGKLELQPLYLRVGDSTVRLDGNSTGKGSITAGGVVGIALLTPGISGRSAKIPVGTKVASFVVRAVELPVVK